MKKRVLSVALALSLCISFPSAAHAVQEGSLQNEDILSEETPEGLGTGDSMVSSNYPATLMATREGSVPTQAEAYEAMIALKEQDKYKEGTTWTDEEPYSASKGYYHWKGGPLGGTTISAVGCVAFAFTLSDAAFGNLPARMYAAGEFSFDDIKVGDILRVKNDVHTVIVLKVSAAGVVVAEGNISTGDHTGKVHWGRAISKEEVLSDTSHYITRYPEGYIPPDDPEANKPIAGGPLDGGLAWKLTKAGTLTISGKGAMPDFSVITDQPWNKNSSQILEVVIENGVTNIGSGAFWNCGVLGVEIPSSVTAIGNNAFQGAQLVSVTVPSSVKTIGDNAFKGCPNLSSVTVCEGVETISQNAFRACTKLGSVTLPASIGEVGDAAFMECTEMKNVKFTPGSKQVKMGDNIFTRCYSLMGVTLPRNIDRIGAGMFQNCGMLAGVEIPQGAESIASGAFASCSGMTTVIIPDSVTIIETAAFSACPLKDIYFTGTEAQWGGIRKIGDTALAVSKATIHYNYIPSEPDDGDDDDNTDGDNDNNTDGDNDNNTDGDNDDNTDGDNDDNTDGDNDDNTDGDNDNNTDDDTDDNTDGDNDDDTDGDNDSNPGGDNDNNNNDDGDNDNDGDIPGGNKPGNGSGSNNTGSGSDRAEGASSAINSAIKSIAETWKPVTPEERKRYACMGKEAIQYTPAKDNAYRIDIENAMQGPMCFQSFEAVLGDYTIGRTYNVYPPSNDAYSMDKEIQFTIKIPSAIYKENRDYKMICVTKDGQPIIYKDLDSNPETITIKTNKFHAYALIYK